MSLAGLFLTPDELRELTGRKLASAQRRWLAANGIEARRRADGKVVVAREHVLEQLGVRGTVQARPAWEPDWSAFDAAPAKEA